LVFTGEAGKSCGFLCVLASLRDAMPLTLLCIFCVLAGSGNYSHAHQSWIYPDRIAGGDRRYKEKLKSNNIASREDAKTPRKSKACIAPRRQDAKKIKSKFGAH